MNEILRIRKIQIECTWSLRPIPVGQRDCHSTTCPRPFCPAVPKRSHEDRVFKQHVPWGEHMIQITAPRLSRCINLVKLFNPLILSLLSAT